MAAEGGFAGNRAGPVENIGRTVKRNVWSAIATRILYHIVPKMLSGGDMCIRNVLTAGVPTFLGCHFF